MREREKKQVCPNCKQLMKYRGSHKFLCKHCKYLWERTEGEWQADKDKQAFFKRTKGWFLITKHAVR